MSLIGTLEQFNLSSVLQRVETHSKTGLLIVKQGAHWVEFYFREGRMIYIGPVRTNATLGERLLQDGVISAQALQQVSLALGSDQPGETRTALALMDLGLVEHSAFRAWATQKAVDVLRVLLTWTGGEMYFEDEVPPPPDRLLVALSVSSLFSSMPAMGPNPTSLSAQSDVFLHGSQPPVRTPQTPPPDVAKLPTLMSASQFFQETPPPMTSLPGLEAFVSPPPVPAPSSPAPRTAPSSPVAPASTPPPTTESLASSPLATGSLPPLFDLGLDEGSSSNSALSRPERVMNPVPPKRIDTSFMRPDMVLAPVDLSAYREQNPPVQLTPHQWRVLTRVDGRTSLQVACQELGMPPALVCQVAGELLAEGLIQLIPPGAAPIQFNELSPVSGSMPAAGLPAAGYVTPGYAATTAPPWSPNLPMSSMASPGSPSIPFETESQWGNGANGATFIPGRGWIATPQPLQPLHSSGSLVAHRGAYAQAGGRR